MFKILFLCFIRLKYIYMYMSSNLGEGRTKYLLKQMYRSNNYTIYIFIDYYLITICMRYTYLKYFEINAELMIYFCNLSIRRL